MAEPHPALSSLVTALAVLLIVSTSRGLSAQECDSLRLIVTPIDGKSGFITGLKPESVRIRVGSTNRKVISSSPHKGPQRLIVVLDFSDSMRRFWTTPENARLVLDNFVDAAPSDVALGAVIFARGTRTISPTTDRELFKRQLTEAIQSVTRPKWQASSPIFDAVSKAGKMLVPFQTGDTLYFDNRRRRQPQ